MTEWSSEPAPEPPPRQSGDAASEPPYPPYGQPPPPYDPQAATEPAPYASYPPPPEQQPTTPAAVSPYGGYPPPGQQPPDQMARVFHAESLVNAGRKDNTVAYLLWFFLGAFGAHRFYMGKTGSAIGMLLLNVISWILTIILIGFIGLFAWFIWWVVDAFMLSGWVRVHNEQLRRAAYGAAG